MNSLLLWQGSRSRNNFVAIGLKDQNIEFSMFSDFTIQAPLRMEKDINYNVTIIKNGGNGNNVDVELHVISWTEQRGRLGGVGELTGDLYANGFKGCISHLEIRKRVRENPPK